MVAWWEMAASESLCDISIKKGLKIWKDYRHLAMLDNQKSTANRFLRQKTVFSPLENALFALRKRYFLSQETSTPPMVTVCSWRFACLRGTSVAVVGRGHCRD